MRQIADLMAFLNQVLNNVPVEKRNEVCEIRGCLVKEWLTFENHWGCTLHAFQRMLKKANEQITCDYILFYMNGFDHDIYNEKLDIPVIMLSLLEWKHVLLFSQRSLQQLLKLNQEANEKWKFFNSLQSLLKTKNIITFESINLELQQLIDLVNERLNYVNKNLSMQK
jgi:hypothetical protein